MTEFKLPSAFIGKTVFVDTSAIDGDSTVELMGEIAEYTEHGVMLECEDGFYYVPWGSVNFVRERRKSK